MVCGFSLISVFRFREERLQLYLCEWKMGVSVEAKDPSP